MKLPISARLLACCDYIAPGDRVADIGCDHGYLGIYLLLSGISPHTIEADIRPGPLSAAVKNGEKYGVEDKMTFYLSNGAQDIPRNFDTLVCAGMGADVMISILSAAPGCKVTGTGWCSNASRRPPFCENISATPAGAFGGSRCCGTDGSFTPSRTVSGSRDRS